MENQGKRKKYQEKGRVRIRYRGVRRITRGINTSEKSMEEKDKCEGDYVRVRAGRKT